MPRIRHALALATGLAAASFLGCWAVHNRNADVDRAPVVNTGAGATIIYPGQAPPPYPGTLHPREAGYGGAGAASSGAPPAGGPGPAPAPYGGTTSSGQRAGGGPGGTSTGGGVSMLGGTEIEETRHVDVSEEPQWMKYAMLPFAVAAAPFEYAAERIRGEPEPGPPVPRNDDQPRPAVQAAPPPLDYETARLQNMERELAMREPQRTPVPTPSAAGGDRSIADELAALRRRTSAPQTYASPAPAPERSPARGEVDRNGDGRTDQWIYRERGVVVREAFDENFDGRPDRTLFYDPERHEVVRLEEDGNDDGRVDTWTALRGNRVVGRRVDDNGDGQVDTWTFYHEGTITRLERDSDGDGFRDHVAHYENGRLAREERDDDGDGRMDLVKLYDENERLERVEEDSDGDGRMDVISHYDAGRLTRREVLDASLLGLGERPPTEHN